MKERGSAARRSLQRLVPEKGFFNFYFREVVFNNELFDEA